MVHAWAEDHHEDEEECDTWVERPCNDRIKARLAQGTSNRQEGAEEVELGSLGPREAK